MTQVSQLALAPLGATLQSSDELRELLQCFCHDDSFTDISQLPNLFIGTPRICNFILLLIVWVHWFSKMLSSIKF